MLLKQVHRRYNPLRDSWVLCSPHRTKRPWQGAQESIPEEKPAYDSECYLCPGNKRAGGSKENPTYESTFVFENDFAAVARPSGENEPLDDGLLRAEPVSGKCVVVCFSPKHNLTLAHMPPKEIELVIDAWCKIYKSAADYQDVRYCQIFENKGAVMGCSNPHPHGQAWMTSIVPDEPAIEHEALVKYHKAHGTHLLEDYVKRELELGERVIDSNDSFVVLVPFWATWPFETMLLPKRRIRSVLELTAEEKADFAAMLSSLTVRYDNLFQCSFPYSMGLHQAFIGECADDVQHLLLHFYPPLLRSATVRKFLVGFELLGMPQRDITPELAAKTLRELPTVHYSKA